MAREAVAIGPKAREILRGILLRRRDEGVRFRSPDQRLKEILEFVRKEFPDAQPDQLFGDVLGFVKAEHGDEECAYYREQNRCPWECGNCGRLWVVRRVDTRTGPGYIVTWQMCGRYRGWMAKKAAEAKPKEQEPESSFAARKGGVGDDRNDIA